VNYRPDLWQGGSGDVHHFFSGDGLRRVWARDVGDRREAERLHSEGRSCQDLRHGGHADAVASDAAEGSVLGPRFVAGHPMDKDASLNLPPLLEADEALRDWLQSQFYCGIRYGLNSFADDNALCLQEPAEPTEEDWSNIKRLVFVERVLVLAPHLAERALQELMSLPEIRSLQFTDLDLTPGLARQLIRFQNLERIVIRPSGPINGDRPGAEVHPEAVRILSALESLTAIELERAVLHPGAIRNCPSCADWGSVDPRSTTMGCGRLGSCQA
jgi:hypothetical protein